MEKITLFWFRRDIRFSDNHGLYKALQHGNVLPIFIFDKTILDKLEDKSDKRVCFIYDEVMKLKSELESMNCTLRIYYDYPQHVFQKLSTEYQIDALYFNHDYEPEAIQRDKQIQQFLQSINIPVFTFKDQVIFEKNDILKSDKQPYTVFTPYMRRWKDNFKLHPLTQYPSEKHFNNFFKTKPTESIDLESMGFKRINYFIPERKINPDKILLYNKHRDYPAIDGTSRLSVHLRFGTISIRRLVTQAAETNEVFLNELIWREFYMMILYHFPKVVNQSFKQQYDKIEWINNENNFELWCKGKTGYPIVDAGMRELNETGFMHNRVRMITASFLTKHLLTDWRWGEAYFAQKLMDYELSSNNGGWQWAASSGCDAVPYFRIFNPELQTKKFDPELNYVRKWIPELETTDYPKPIIEHTIARERVLKEFKKIQQ
ncbi:MAG: deoxyribodipyrimidine photo-lyase [Bacteroidales bacterium]|jgi:deoxyribodipyrimidine photo-lyase|nr:deoxyribodipyrimidine photo-lyase [Bacteroidales bacterium]